MQLQADIGLERRQCACLVVNMMALASCGAYLKNACELAFHSILSSQNLEIGNLGVGQIKNILPQL
jgi:hypothetical protein